MDYVKKRHFEPQKSYIGQTVPIILKNTVLKEVNNIIEHEEVKSIGEELTLLQHGQLDTYTEPWRTDRCRHTDELKEGKNNYFSSSCDAQLSFRSVLSQITADLEHNY